MKACPAQVLLLVISADSNTPRCSSRTPDTSSLHTSNLLWTRTGTTSVLNMIFIYAWSALVWIFLSAQVPVQGVLTEVVKLKHVPQEGKTVTLTAEYTSDGVGNVAAEWKIREKIVEGTNENGRTSVTVTVGTDLEFYEKVHLRLGDLKAHFVKIYWKVDKYDSYREQQLNYTMAKVDPGTNLVHNPSKRLEFSITTWAQYAPNDLCDFFLGTYYEDPNNTGKIFFKASDQDTFIKKETSATNGRCTTSLTVEEGEFPISGYSIGTLERETWATDLFQQFTEYVIFKIHQAGKDVSFPVDPHLP